MAQALTMMKTTVGKKAALAVSGLVLFGFVIAHMLGNLQVFLGPEVLNAYAAMLHASPALLWGARLVLILAVVVHIWMMIELYDRSNAARPMRYQRVERRAVTYSSAAMKYSGPALLLFIAFHLMHFTVPGVALGDYQHHATDVYSNMVNAFQIPWVAGTYVLANVFLGMHLFHGAWSLLQSLGLNHVRYNQPRKRIAQSLALLVTIGNISMPLAIVTGMIGS